MKSLLILAAVASLCLAGCDTGTETETETENGVTTTEVENGVGTDMEVTETPATDMQTSPTGGVM